MPDTPKIIRLKKGQKISDLKIMTVRYADVIIGADGRYIKNRFGRENRFAKYVDRRAAVEVENG